MIRLCALLLRVALVSLVGLVANPLKRLLRHWRMKSWRDEHGGPPDEVLESFNDDEVRMKTWLQSRTIHGLLASGVAAVLGWFVLDADAATLAAQVSEWILNGVQIGGLVYAARGRKLAEGPLA